MAAPAPTAALAEHHRLVRDARAAGGWPGALVAAWAGVTAAEARLDLDCPFGPAETLLAEWWRRGRTQGLATPVPAATVHRLSPGKPWSPIPGCTQAAHAVGTEP